MERRRADAQVVALGWLSLVVGDPSPTRRALSVGVYLRDGGAGGNALVIVADDGCSALIIDIHDWGLGQFVGQFAGRLQGSEQHVDDRSPSRGRRREAAVCGRRFQMLPVVRQIQKGGEFTGKVDWGQGDREPSPGAAVLVCCFVRLFTLSNLGKLGRGDWVHGREKRALNSLKSSNKNCQGPNGIAGYDGQLINATTSVVDNGGDKTCPAINRTSYLSSFWEAAVRRELAGCLRQNDA
ncbi:hypothetical protein B0T17DRAFT_126225 [Bombardia bombarda]|uniref:Uncharacterized protein n=1 Tax=Bombardia bombarda TaxID=252184 RepID=A0AA39W9R3_9PEZI|nr:hypothetical protein B0T17DRAFT_126225 [Bombardia bombarda]